MAINSPNDGTILAALAGRLCEQSAAAPQMENDTAVCEDRYYGADQKLTPPLLQVGDGPNNSMSQRPR